MYFPAAPAAIEVAANDKTAAPLALVMPFARETAAEAKDRAARAATLHLQADQVPIARRDDLDLEVEWALTNLDDTDGSARLAVNGANEGIRYLPAAPTAANQDVPPPLMSGAPIALPAGATVTGAILEGDLAEAAQDLDAVSRAGVPLLFALLSRWPTLDITGGTGELPAIPSAAVPALLEVDVAVVADRHVRFTAVLRVRDRSGHLRTAGAGDLMPPSSTVYAPPVTP